VAVTVLIVDDHPSFRKFARRLLEEAGFAVVGEAEDGPAAIEAARALRPEVVLLDVVLPGQSGLEVADRLAREPSPPAVVLTSSRSAEDFGVALAEAPARGFIAKASFSGAALGALVR
jgi:DNA-binding NarL/FixJ family response regulator